MHGQVESGVVLGRADGEGLGGGCGICYIVGSYRGSRYKGKDRTSALLPFRLYILEGGIEAICTPLPPAAPPGNG